MNWRHEYCKLKNILKMLSAPYKFRRFVQKAVNALKVVFTVANCKSSFVSPGYIITNAEKSSKPPRMVYLRSRSFLFCIFHLPSFSFIADTNLHQVLYSKKPTEQSQKIFSIESWHRNIFKPLLKILIRTKC
jgi:hypothetical protein